MATALTTLNALKISMGIPLSDTSMDTQLQGFVDAASAAIAKWCHRDFASQSYTEFQSGDGRSDLVLRQRPVASITSVNVDQYGRWGQKAGGFGPSTLLVSGDDYALDMDGNGVSESGLLRRISGLNMVGWPGMYYPSGFRAGYTLSGWDRGVVWPVGDGNIKLVYVTAFTVPADLQEGANLFAKQLKAMETTGLPIGSENYIDYAVTVLNTQKALLTDVRTILAQYRERTW